MPAGRIVAQGMSDVGGELHRYLFSRAFSAVNGAAILILMLLPRHGLGFSTCGLQYQLGLPCPGCGMTRSLACMFQLHWGEALHYHPFGPLLAGAMLFFSGLLLLSGARLERLRNWFNRRVILWLAVYLGLAGMFILFGIMRIGWALYSPQSGAWPAGAA